MRSRGYRLGMIVLVTGVCLSGMALRASAQGQPEGAAVATDEATLTAALNGAPNGSAGGLQPRAPTTMRTRRWGAEGGFTNSGISYDNDIVTPSRRWGGLGGGYVEWAYDNYDPACFWCRFDYMIDLIYDTKGAKFPLGKEQEVLGLKYLEFIPSIQYKFYTTPGWSLHAGLGPQFGLKLHEHHTVNDQTLNVADFTKSTDFGLSFDVGIRRDKWGAWFRYTQGFTNIIENPGSFNLTARNNSVQMYVGYALGKRSF